MSETGDEIVYVMTLHGEIHPGQYHVSRACPGLAPRPQEGWGIGEIRLGELTGPLRAFGCRRCAPGRGRTA